MSVLKDYSITTNFPNGFILEDVDSAIRDSGFVEGFSGLSSSELENKIYVSGVSIIDEPALDALIVNYIPDFVPSIVLNSVHENKAYADNMMQRLKQKNIIEGLSSIDQAAWIHHRLRKIDYTLSDNVTVVQIDVMNLVVSGDIETAEQVLGQIVPDDMTQAYHWLSQARIDWIRNDIRTYLGWPLL